MIKGR